MIFRSTGWLWIATICQALIQALHAQTPAASPAPSPSPSAVQPVSEPEEWKVEGPIPEQLPPQPGAEQMPQTGAPEVPLEQEPGWSGELNKPTPENSTQFELPPSQLPVDLRAAGLKLRFGPIDIRPVFSFNAMYDDNIEISNTYRKEDFVYTLSPGVFLGLGDYIQREANGAGTHFLATITLLNRSAST
jgi:hypothetical protein